MNAWLYRHIVCALQVVTALAVLTGETLVRAPMLSAQEFIKRVQPSVFRITVPGKGRGTGFLIGGSRLVATNHHVIEGGTEFLIWSLHTANVGGQAIQNMRRTRARLVTSLPQKDLAILLAEEDLQGTVLPLAGYDPDAASPVVAIGYPGAAEDATRSDRLVAADLISTVTLGHTSRVVPATATDEGRKLVQHTAAISGGNSGGPLFDSCGVVVGINTFLPGSRVSVENNRIKVRVPQGIFFSVHSSELAALAASINLPVTVAAQPCTPGQTTVAAGAEPSTQSAPSVAQAVPGKQSQVAAAASTEAPARLSPEDERRGSAALARLRSCLNAQPCDSAICETGLRRDAPAGYIQRIEKELANLQGRADETCRVERSGSRLAALKQCAETSPCDYVGRCEPEATADWTPEVLSAREAELGRLRVEARHACFKRHKVTEETIGGPVVRAGCYRAALRFEASKSRSAELERGRCFDRRGIAMDVDPAGAVRLGWQEGERTVEWRGRVDAVTGDLSFAAADLTVKDAGDRAVTVSPNVAIDGKMWSAKVEFGACGVGTLVTSLAHSSTACDAGATPR